MVGEERVDVSRCVAGDDVIGIVVTLTFRCFFLASSDPAHPPLTFLLQATLEPRTKCACRL